ncbi:MAG: hypothetical protein HFH83_04575 [Lachnospiraceae bacterium]|jgi:phage-related protein|nr:hypothetical protein [Lachnospiraceae bacterium]
MSAAAGIAFELHYDGSRMLTEIKDYCNQIEDKITESFRKAGCSAREAVKTSNADIQAILNDTTRSAKAKASAIAAIYRKEGDSMSEAMTKAWSHIERESGKSSKKARKDMVHMSDQADQTAEDIKESFSGSFSTVAKKAAIAFAAAFSVKKLIDFGAECLNLGSDLQEVQNVVDVTFPSMTRQVEEFAGKAATSFGLSETMAKQFVGTFGAMAKAFGFSEEAAYDMSAALTGLAGDVASFYNITQEEAYTKLKSVFTGETESLKDLGIVMTQTALDSYAIANGFGKTTAKMTEAEKVALRYRFIQEQLTGAAGDFMRTSDGWANQVRVLKLQFDSLKAAIGQGLINVLTPVIKLVNTLVGRLMTLANAFKAFTEMLSGKKGMGDTAGQMQSTAAAADKAAAATKGIGTAAAASAKKMKGLFAFDDMNVLGRDEDTGGASGGLVPEGYGADAFQMPSVDTEALQAAAVGTGAVLAGWKELGGLFRQGFEMEFGRSGEKAETLRQQVQGIGEELRSIFMDPEVTAAAGEMLDSFALELGRVSGSFAGIGVTAADNLLGGFDGYLQGSQGYLRERLVSLFRVSGEVAGLAGEFAAAVGEIFDVFGGDAAKGCTEHLIGIFADGFAGASELALRFGADVAGEIATPIIENKDKIKEALENTLAPLDGILGSLHDLVRDTFSKILQVYEEYLKPAFDRITSGLSTVFAGVLDAYNIYLAPVLGWLAERFSALVGEYIQPLINAFLEFAGKVSEAVSMLWEFISPFVAWIAEVFAAKIAETVQWLWTKVELFVSAIAAVIQGIIEVCSGLIDFIVGVFTGDWEKAWDGVKQIFNGILDAVKGIFGAAINFIANIFVGLVGKVRNTLNLLKSVITSILNAIKTVFTNIFDGIRDSVSGIIEGTCGFIKDSINSILNCAESMANGIVRGINTMIGALNSIHVDIPEWVPLVGGKSFGISLVPVPEVSIPRLAEGGFVRANTPQLAMIGDNRHQGEIVAPEDKLYQVSAQAMKDVMQQFMAALASLLNTAQGKTTTIVLKVSGEMAPFVRLLKVEMEKEAQRVGADLKVVYE